MLFAAAIDATVRLAHERGLIDAKDLAIDSVRLRAHASTKAVRTRERSTKRLAELKGIDPRDLPKGDRKEHAAKLKKHREDRPKAYFGRGAFEIDGSSALCPAGTPMRGPYPDANGRLKWIGVGCSDCPEKPRCTPGRERALTVSPAAEAMRDRLERKGARERYNRRIATVEPIFSAIEDTMGFRRVSSRLPETVRAEILLKVLAHNVARLVTAKRVRCVYVLVDGF